MADVAKLPTSSELPVDKSQKNEICEEIVPPTKEFRASETHVHSTNSHHHDSEYDTASDLEGPDEDDYDDEEDDDSIGLDGDEDGESENGSIGFDVERQRGDGQEQTDYTKKVDEDRSNPQYIPKKGTFYEHDDRTADEPASNEPKSEENAEGEGTKSATPIISASSKTMKKWQPASAVDRWSHDRYEESEQAPKSRAELVSAYGYDIRNEDGPPRARRRRRYGRGPSKYLRNWEDESAYVKNSNAQRKPRPEDFPALGDNERKPRRSRNFRDEKENRIDRHERSSGHRGGGNSSSARDGRIERSNSGKGYRTGRYGMDFKNQNRKKLSNENSSNRISSNRQGDKEENKQPNDVPKVQVESVSFTNAKLTTPNDRYNGHENNTQPTQPQPIREVKEMAPPASSSAMPNRQPSQPSPLTQRLQVQNRHDSNAVATVQMQTIVPPQNPAPEIQPQGAEANRTKRYSSLRQRSQNEVGMNQQSHEQHGLQQIQIHEQQHKPPQQQQQHVLIQDQHLLQANLMQIYHQQENIQNQMQNVSIQGLPSTHQAKPQYQNVNVQQQYQGGNTAPAYYSPSNEYNAGATPPNPPQYTQQSPATYIQPQQAPPPLAYNPPNQPPVPPPAQQLPGAINYVQNPQPPPAGPPYQSFPPYPNYNTVGGTTYFVPQQQPTSRPVVLTQRRPTNAIPILAPPTDKTKTKNDKEDEMKNSIPSTAPPTNAPIGSAENIDHILDNMFVQRAPYQPPTRKSSSPSTESIGTSTITSSDDKNSTTQVANSIGKSNEENRLEDAVKNLSLADDNSTPSNVVVEPPKQSTQQPSESNPTPQEVTHNETG